MTTIEDNRPTDLHMDIRVKDSAGTSRVTPKSMEMQSNLQQDVRDLVAEYSQYLGISLPKSFSTSIVEIVSEDTRRYIWKLETLLRHAANTTDNAKFADEIDQALR